MKTAVIVYQVAQIKMLERFMAGPLYRQDTHMVVALGADIELALETLGIPFASGKNLRKCKHLEFVGYAERLGAQILDDPSLSFFTYRGVSLGDTFMFALQSYFVEVLYFLDLLTSVAEQGLYNKMVLFSSTAVVFEAGGIFAHLENNAAADAAGIVAASFGLQIDMSDSGQSRSMLGEWATKTWFECKRATFSLALAFLNWAVALIVPPKTLRIVATEYWKNIYPLLYNLPEAEMFLLDRTESRKAGLRAIWRHRMQFLHIGHFLSLNSRRIARQKRKDFLTLWRGGKGANMPLNNAKFRGHAIEPLVSRALERMMGEGTERAVRLIEGSYAMLVRLHPDLVWVRASISAQIHFSILCRVARSLGIPSLEIQHGIFLFGEGSFFHRPAAQYLASYGPQVSENLKSLGYTDETLINIGSPRFDVYAKERPAHISDGSFTVVCVMPVVIPQSWSDSYEIVEYLRDLRRAVEGIPNIKLILKLRPGISVDGFYHTSIARELKGVAYDIAQEEPIVDVFSRADAIVAIFSTTALEALLSGKPTVFSGIVGMHGEFSRQFEQHEKAGALRIARTPEDLQEALELLSRDKEAGKQMVARARAFMEENYSFDGKASQKLAAVVRKLASQRR